MQKVKKLINPVLIGNIEFMTAFIDKHKWSLSKDKLIESYSEEESSKIACEVASRDTGLEKNIIIKGHLHTDVLMGEYIKKEYNLRIRGKRLSHIWFMTFPNDSRNPIIITDGALNISPSLETKNIFYRMYSITLKKFLLSIHMLPFYQQPKRN